MRLTFEISVKGQRVNLLLTPSLPHGNTIISSHHMISISWRRHIIESIYSNLEMWKIVVVGWRESQNRLKNHLGDSPYYMFALLSLVNGVVVH